MKLEICWFNTVQEKPWQELELPEPALCNGGLLLVELLGRVKKKGSTFEIGFVSHTNSIKLSR